MAHLTSAVVTINICGVYSGTKLAMLKAFINRNSYDVVLLQEVSFSFYGYQEIINLNPQKRGMAILCKDGLPLKNVELLPDGRGIALKMADVLFVNIYAPSGSQHKRDRDDFFAKNITPLCRCFDGKVIFGGDFNCVIEKNQASGREICRPLLQIVQELRLRDSWLIRGQGEGVTYRSFNTASRIDRIYRVSQKNVFIATVGRE